MRPDAGQTDPPGAALPLFPGIALDGHRAGLIDRFLSLFANVRPREGATLLLLLLNVFTLLTAYYIIKPVREALILGEVGAEIKSYASAIQAALFLVIVPIYSHWSSRVNRLWLINGVTALFVSNLCVFYFLGQRGLSVGIPFYLWTGLFNVVLIAQFWAFANDIYTRKRGERLFGVIGIGGSLGSIAGALFAREVFKSAGPYLMMLVSAIFLGVSMALTAWIHCRESGRERGGRDNNEAAAGAPLPPGGGFRLVFGSRYLLMIALLVVVSNCVNTTGEFILGKTVSQSAQIAAQGSAQPATAAKIYIGEFYADFFFWVNLVGAGLQTLVVSRLMQSWGTSTVLFLLPLIALGGYATLAMVPLLGLIRFAKIAENTVDYSIQNTARHALFLPTSREAKYKAKTAIDSFYWRMGDTLSGLLVLVGTQLAMNIRMFAAANVLLALVWLGVVVALARSMRGRSSRARLAA
jgi:AAA family ATP:ADP antiporter